QEDVGVGVDQAGEDRGFRKVDGPRSRGDRHGGRVPHAFDALPLDDDHLIAANLSRAWLDQAPGPDDRRWFDSGGPGAARKGEQAQHREGRGAKLGPNAVPGYRAHDERWGRPALEIHADPRSHLEPARVHLDLIARSLRLELGLAAAEARLHAKGELLAQPV